LINYLNNGKKYVVKRNIGNRDRNFIEYRDRNRDRNIGNRDRNFISGTYIFFLVVKTITVQDYNIIKAKHAKFYKDYKYQSL